MTSQVPEKKSGRLMRQLKSPKVWVSVIATALASLAFGLYLEYRADVKLIEVNAHSAKQLKTEITWRSARVMVYLSDIGLRGDVRGFAKLIEETGSVRDGTYPMKSFFRKYADFDLTSLLFELRSVSTNNCFGDKILDIAASSTVEIRNIISEDTSGGTPESKLDARIRKVVRKINLVLLVMFLDAENKFSPPSDSGISPELLANIYSIKRTECG